MDGDTGKNGGIRAYDKRKHQLMMMEQAGQGNSFTTGNAFLTATDELSLDRQAM